jgi:hypothetical protein
MTRRVRADWTSEGSDFRLPLARRTARVQGPTTPLADWQADAQTESHRKSSAE